MLELDHITQHYDGRPLAQDVSLRVAPGQTVALLGASGSGKSTLLKIVAGLLAPEAGRVLWAGQDLAAVPPERRGFALMFQDFALFPHLDVRDNVAFGLIEQRQPKAQEHIGAKGGQGKGQRGQRQAQRRPPSRRLLQHCRSGRRASNPWAAMAAVPATAPS